MAPFVPSRVKAAQDALRNSANPASGQKTGAAAAPLPSPAGVWYISALCIKLKHEEYAAFGQEPGEDTYIPRVDRARWSGALSSRFEREPLLAPLRDNFKLAADRQQRALLVCSHNTLSDHNIDKASYVAMLLKVCQKLGDGSLIAASSGNEGQQQQRCPLTIRSSKGDFLRSAKMHFKADVPVDPYLAFMYSFYGTAPQAPYGILPLSPLEVGSMRERLEDDTRPFWPVLQQQAFTTGHDDPLGGLQLSPAALERAAFSCLPASLQPAGCQGTWWADITSPLLVFLPGNLSCSRQEANSNISSRGASVRAVPATQTSQLTGQEERPPSSPPSHVDAATTSPALPGPSSPMSSLSLSDAAPSQRIIVEGPPSASAAAAAAAPAHAHADHLLTPGQVYDELSRFQQRFMANSAVTGCSVCMVPCHRLVRAV